MAKAAYERSADEKYKIETLKDDRKMLGVVCSVVWMRNMDAKERINSSFEFFGNVDLEKDDE